MMDEKTAKALLDRNRRMLEGSMRFLLQQEAELKEAREVLGIDSKPAPSESKTEAIDARPARPLSKLEKNILLVHLDEGTSSVSLLATKCGKGRLGLLDALEKRRCEHASEGGVKRAQRELRGRGFLRLGKSGPGGGSYLTSTGKRMAIKIRDSS